jgi:two-component system CheB/CheR fusion protein
LRPALTTTLHKAVVNKQPVHHAGLRVKTNGDFTTVNLTVQPVPAGQDAAVAPNLFLVVFEGVLAVDPQRPEKAAVHDAGEGGAESTTEADGRISMLKQELQAKEEYFQITSQELQSTNEALRSSNEEMQSVNEEIQSTNEELETSKEELHSVNEELATVNAELQTKGGRPVAR